MNQVLTTQAGFNRKVSLSCQGCEPTLNSKNVKPFLVSPYLARLPGPAYAGLDSLAIFLLYSMKHNRRGSNQIPCKFICIKAGYQSMEQEPRVCPFRVSDAGKAVNQNENLWVKTL